MKLRTVLLLALLFISSLTYGQRKLDKAEQLFCKYAFSEAIEHYKDYLDKAQDPDPIAYLHLGICYRNIGQPEKALQWFEKSVKYPQTSPEDYIIYAELLQQTQQLDSAKVWFKRYLDSVPGARRGLQGIASVENVDYLTTNPNNYWVENVSDINSPASDMSPTLYKNKLLFASDRNATKYSNKTFEWTGGNFYNMFQSEEKAPGELTFPRLLTGNANSQYHDGPVTFTNDGERIIFCRTHDEMAEVEDDCPKREIYNLKLVSADYNHNTNSWRNVSDKEFVNINNPDYLVMHPAISSDGNVLYFTSDNPNYEGYQGGTDIYMSTKGENGVWSRPSNLGPTINSSSNEAFPYISQDTVLYYSSDANLGQGGLGGLDIYKAEYNNDLKQFKQPENLGAPINSYKDDFGILIAEEDDGDKYGYFSSNRGKDEDKKAKGKDDIYFFKAREPFHLKVIAYDSCENKRISKAPFVMREGLDTIHMGTTNSEGVFTSDSLLRVDRKYTVRAFHKIMDKAEAFVTDGLEGGDTMTVMVSFDEWCTISGVVYNEVTSKVLSNAEITAENVATGAIQTTTTDSSGYYLFSVEPSSTYKITASKFGNLNDEATVKTTGDKCQEIHQDLNLQPSGLFLTNVYYYFDKAYINRYPEALADLNALVEFLNDNPKYNIEIRSHTDSRGSYTYNEKLAQRRAQSVKDYLIDKGIDEERLQPIAYGEYCLTNHCKDVVNCTEVEHQRNRRTTVKVINYEGELVLETKEKEMWTQNEDLYVEGGKYYDEGKGSNWKEEENFEGKYGDWREIPVRKDCGGVLRQKKENAGTGNSSKSSSIRSKEQPGKLLEDGTHYMVQFAASVNKDDSFPKAEQIGSTVTEQYKDYTRYMLGPYDNETKAQQITDELKNLGFDQSYMVKYVNGKRQ